MLTEDADGLSPDTIAEVAGPIANLNFVTKGIDLNGRIRWASETILNAADIVGILNANRNFSSDAVTRSFIGNKRNFVRIEDFRKTAIVQINIGRILAAQVAIAIGKGKEDS